MSPKNKLNINNQKINIMVSMMRDVRSHINGWHQQVYTASIWGVGIYIGTAGYWVVNYYSLVSYKKLFFIAILLFGIFIQFYLWLSIKALKDNGSVLTRCEKSLSLHQKGEYIEKTAFFDFRSKDNSQNDWVAPNDCYIITILNGIILLCVLGTIIFFSGIPNLSTATDL